MPIGKGIELFYSTATNMFNRNNAPTPEQQELFSKWSFLTDEQKRLLLDLMNTM